MFRDNYAARLGRADIGMMPIFGSPTNGAIAADDSMMGTGTGMNGFTAGRLGLALLIVYVGAITTAYVATRARQF